MTAPRSTVLGCLAVVVAAVASLGVAAAGRAQDRGPIDGPGVPPVATAPAVVGTSRPGSPAGPLAPPAAAATVRFETVDVYVDPGDRPLAAYQFTVRATGDNAQLVGLEGGEHPAFAAPPYFDKEAIGHERVVVAALNASGDLPRGKTRVARLHVQVTGPADPNYEATLQAAAGPEGTPVPATVTVRPTSG